LKTNALSLTHGVKSTVVNAMLPTVIQQVKGGWELSDKILSLYT